jgi:RNA polymerase sigma factor (sigma-70 family)
MGAVTDEELLERAQQGYLAFVELLDRLAPAVIRSYCRRFALRPWDREDLLHSTYERTWRAYFQHLGARPKRTVARLRAWMCTVAYRLSINLYRANRRLVRLQEPLEPVSPDPAPGEDQLTAEALDHARAKHGDRDVDLWVENKVHGVPVQELAKQYGLTIYQVSYAIEKVQKTLEKWMTRG